MPQINCSTDHLTTDHHRYYYAFFSNLDSDASYFRMAVTILSLMTAGQWTGAFIDICAPSIIHRVKMYRMKVHVQGANKELHVTSSR